MSRPTCPACEAPVETSAKACIACGEPLDNPAWTIEPGTVFASRFEILAALGRGGMGMVYKARDRQLGETIALKLLRPDVARASAHMRQRFQSEIRLARKVRHRNVCSVFGDGEHEGLFFICLELIEGGDLRRLARKPEPLAEATAYDLAIQAAEGLQAIHDTGIIHRDLKSANIMRDSHGVVRLMDFGIAKQHVGNRDATATAPATATGALVGTLEYMSPEQIRGEPLDFRSDLYSLGIVIFELFTGRLPFLGDTPAETMMRQLQEPPPLDGPTAARLPAPLRPVLRRVLAKNREERFASARALADVLRAAQSGHVVDDSPPAPPKDSDRPAPRRRPAWLLGLIPAAALAAVGMWLASDAATPSTRGPEPARPEPEAPARPRAATGGLRVLGDARGARVILDGTFSGLTPLELTQLPPGPHQVAIEVAGRETWKGPVTIEEGATVILALRQLPAAAPANQFVVQREPEPAPVAAAAQSSPSPGKVVPPAAPDLKFPMQEAEIAYANPRMATTLFGWKAVPNAVAYHVVVDTTPGFNRPFVDRKNLPDVTLMVRGLDAGNYYWKVAAIDKDGAEGSFSGAWRFVIAKGEGDRTQYSVFKPQQAPWLTIDLLDVRGKILQIKGRTEAGASVTANGERLDVQPDGSFSGFVTLEKPDQQTLVVRATASNGGVREEQRTIDVK